MCLTSHFQDEDHPPLVSTLSVSGRELTLVRLWGRQVCLRHLGEEASAHLVLTYRMRQRKREAEGKMGWVVREKQTTHSSCFILHNAL